jgi:hypothetical protein
VRTRLELLVIEREPEPPDGVELSPQSREALLVRCLRRSGGEHPGEDISRSLASSRQAGRALPVLLQWDGDAIPTQGSIRMVCHPPTMGMERPGARSSSAARWTVSPV